jgi:hypothetical protein
MRYIKGSLAQNQRSKTTMNINREKVRRVRRVLGTKTDTEAVDRALDVVLANTEINTAIDACFGQIPNFKVS